MRISGFFALLLSLTIDASPYNGPQQIKNKEIVGQATNIITSKILKGEIDNNKNSVFSPIGYASILAILSEGAQDETNHDIVTLLKHPEDRAEVRSAYHSVLKHLQRMEPTMSPQFRSWFYIYKNNTVNESYKKLIVDEYFVTIRDVEPFNVYEMAMNPVNPSTERIHDEKPSLVDLMDVQLKNGVQPLINNSKDIVELDSFKLESGPVDETRIDTQKDASKFDEIVEDRQYVDGAAIKDEIKRAESTDALNSVAEDESNEGTTVQSIEAKKDADVEEKFTLPLKQLEQMEIMHAEESRVGKSVS